MFGARFSRFMICVTRARVTWPRRATAYGFGDCINAYYLIRPNGVQRDKDNPASPLASGFAPGYAGRGAVINPQSVWSVPFVPSCLRPLVPLSLRHPVTQSPSYSAFAKAMADRPVTLKRLEVRPGGSPLRFDLRSATADLRCASTRDRRL